MGMLYSIAMFCKVFLLSSLVLLTACSSGGVAGTGSDEVTVPVQQPSTQVEIVNIAGDTTVNDRSSSAFSRHVKNLVDVKRIRLFNIGDDFFENPWVEKTASTELRDGLGPLFNNNACQDCHVRDGRGHAPLADSREPDHFNRMIFKAVRTRITNEQTALMEAGMLGGVGDSAVGGQLQHHGILGVGAEVQLAVSYEYSELEFSDGYRQNLRRPLWEFVVADSNQNFDVDTLFSPRIAQSMQGVGLLGMISEEDIRALADPLDLDGDGISGRVNEVWDVQESRVTLGRFGWKAGQPNIRQQAAGAFNGDMGLTNEIFSNDHCLQHQSDCLAAPNGNGDSAADYDYEVATSVLDAVEFYAKHLAVPARRGVSNADVIAGKQLFLQAGCDACHHLNFTTVNDPAFPELSNQTIVPFSDMLLHDMGPELADVDVDNMPGSHLNPTEYRASASEWRTTPLWGLGLVKTVLPDAGFLHDGRARTIMEAVLWHGGEAQGAQREVLTFDEVQRRQFIAFLESL